VPEKRYLMTPGPTPAPPQVLAALSAPVIHHRARDYRELFETLLRRLGEVFQTRHDVLVYTCSGTGGMESAITNVCRLGERALVVSAGYFGERFGEIARAYGCDVMELRYDWGETPSADDLRARIDETAPAVVLLTHSETSTGVVADMQALSAACGDSLVVCDAISSLGAIPLETDAWGVDVVVTGSQKALMTPPGLAAVSVSETAWERSRIAGLPRYYFDWERVRTAQAQFDAAFTPAVSLVGGLNVALGLILEEGLEAAFDRHIRLGRACREGIKAMGLELFSPDEDRSAVVTAVSVPEEIDSGELVATIRDRFGITLAPGQGPLKGRIFRIGHIGYYDIFDITTALAGVELALAEMGADIERGVAVGRALEVFEHTTV
jgi:aspartate aminotransferase-like enzyme